MRQRHQIQIANFDMSSLRVIWFRWARLWLAGTSKQVEPRARDATAHNMVVRQTVQHVPCFRRFSRSEYCSEPLPQPDLLLPKGFGLYACPLCRFPLLLICPHSVKLFGNLHSQVSVEVSINRFPNPIPASHEIHSHTELREHIYRDPSLWSTYAELQQQIYRYPRLWRRDVISQRLQPSSTHAKKLAAVIVVLGFVFCLWFGVPTYRPPLTSYPYYDTQRPVPPWSEPMPLEGNYDRPETAFTRSSFP